jgi:hypothetical protein
VCLTIAAALALSAAPAGAAWSPFVNVVTKNYVSQPKVAMDSAGNAVFMWMQGSDATGYPVLYTRVREAAGSLSPIQRIGMHLHFGDEYDLAVDSDGNAYYVWTARDSAGREQLRTRVRFADGTLSRVQTLKTVANGDFIRGTVGVDASGTAAYAWDHRDDDRGDLLQARIRSPSGMLGPVRDIGTGYLLNWGNDANMAVDASGNATFAWTMGATPDDGWIHAFTRVLAANGSLGPVREVSRAGRPGNDPQVVVTPSGRALFGWSEYDEDSGAVNLLVRPRSADGDFKAPQLVAKTHDLAAGGPSLQLRMAPTAEAVVGWRTDHALLARTRAPGGALGTTKTITKAIVRGFDLGIDSPGSTVFAWTVWPQDGSKARVFVRPENAGGTLGPTRALSPAGYNAHPPVLDMTPAGAAAAAWAVGGQGWGIQASFGP